MHRHKKEQIFHGVGIISVSFRMSQCTAYNVHKEYRSQCQFPYKFNSNDILYVLINFRYFTLLLITFYRPITQTLGLL